MDNPNQPETTQSVTVVARPAHRNVTQTPLYPAAPYGFEAPTDEDAGLNLFEYCAIIFRNKVRILLAGSAGLIIGFAVGIPMKPVYRAKTTLEVLAMNEEFMNMKQTNPVNIGMDSEVSEEETQAALLTSYAVNSRVAARLDPDFISRPSKPKSPAWRTLLHLDSSAPASERSILVDKAASSLKVKTKPHTRVLEATVDSSDPNLAADYLNTLAQEFIQQNQEARIAANRHTGDWLSEELGDARDKLRKSEDALQEYARSSGIILTNETTNVATEKLQQYQQSLTAASADRIAKQSRLELAQSSPPASLADVLNDTSLRDTQGKINDLQRQIADLSTVYSPEYSKLQRLQAELRSLQIAFDRQRSDILSRIRTDYLEASRKEGLLAAAYNSQTHEVTGQGEKSIQYNILKREVDSNRLLYDSMLQQMKQASIATALRASNIRIVDAADAPSIPVFPNFKINSAVGFLAGLLLSTAVFLVRNQIDRTLQLPGDIKQWTDLHELGTIPNASLAANKFYYPNYRSRSITEGQESRKNAAKTFNMPDSSPGQSIELATWQKGRGLLAESFRSALTSILFVGENGSRPRVIVISSANPAEGKTTAVSNLALAASEVRLKVLIIDADLRRPRMHLLFNLPNELGLTTFLQEDLNPKSLASLVQQSSVSNLHVLTAGPETFAAANLLHSPNFAALLANLRNQYDMILIDTPPMLHMTDARIIGREADAVVLVARAGSTTRDSLVAAKERFHDDRTSVLGTILNDWDPKRPSGKYYKGSSRAYSY